MNPITGLLAALGAVAALFTGGWAAMVRASKEKARPPHAGQVAVGGFTNFFDTLGISSFATTTTIFRVFDMVDDRVIPGTLNVGHTLPTVVQTFIYTTLIPVDVPTLFSMIGASILGAWFGAGIVARWPKRYIQIGMGVALLIAAGTLFMTQLKLFPGGGDALGVSGFKFVIAVSVNFFLGALMTLGIGLYAPCMILVSLLGMNPKAAFPIMMGSCAFLMPAGSIRFIREKSYNMRAAAGLAIGGIPGVLLAAYIVKELPLEIMRWLVIAVVTYTSISMLWAARAGQEIPATTSPDLPQFQQSPFANRGHSTD